MKQIVIIASSLVLFACSSGSGGGSGGGKTIGELRSACNQGDRSACNAVTAHDGLL